MRIGDKGQGAMEYLMTYGWAILVVMIVGIVLWQLGVFGGAGGGVNRATGFTTIKCFDRSIQYTSGATGTLNATFTNAAGRPVIIRAVNATGDCSYAPAAAIDTTLLAGGGAGTEKPLAAGETVIFSCPAGNTVDKQPKDTFSAEIDIIYTESVAGTTLTHTDHGRLTGTVEA